MGTRQHLLHTAFATALAALLQACATPPTELPGRVGFPDGGREMPDAEPKDREGEATDAELADLMDGDLFSPVREALARHDWMAATLALPQRQSGPDDETFKTGDVPAVPSAPFTEADRVVDLWTRYYEARIAYLRGDLSLHEERLQSLDEPLPDALTREILEHRLALARSKEDAAAELLLLRDLAQGEKLTAAYQESLRQDMWRAAQQLSGAQVDDLRRMGNRDLDGWLDLAGTRRMADARNAAAAIDYWLDDNPDHDARAIAGELRNGALRDSGTTRLALLLPLSGPLQSAGDAVARGFTAAFYEAGNPGLELTVLDSRRYDSPVAAYGAARSQGADVVIGPLSKIATQELLSSGNLDIPLLTLNRGDGAAAAGALELSMAPEDEAQQLAEWAWSDGARRALMVRPDSDWGRRMEAALRPRFAAQGGQIPVIATYGKPASYSDTLRDALGIGASAQRSSALRNLFPARVETEGRRRQDLDAIFLLCKNSEEARALKPLVNYHFAGDLPVYAISSADTGRSDRTLNRDLGNLRILALPWRLDADQVPGLTVGDESSLSALHALGADAFAIALRWWRMDGSAPLLFDGYTATLSKGQGALERRLTMAEFDRGRLRPR